jgi:hypothetical protein
MLESYADMDQKTQVSLAYFAFCALAALKLAPSGLEHATMFVLGAWSPTLAHKFKLAEEPRFDGWVAGFLTILVTTASVAMDATISQLLTAFCLGIGTGALIAYHTPTGVRFRENRVSTGAILLPALSSKRQTVLRIILAMASLAILAPIFVPRAIAQGTAIAAQIVPN